MKLDKIEGPVEPWGFELKVGAITKAQAQAEIKSYNRQADYIQKFRIGSRYRPEVERILRRMARYSRPTVQESTAVTFSVVKP